MSKTMRKAVDHPMKPTRVMAIVALMTGNALASHAVHAQQTGIKRIDLQEHDLDISEREAVQVRVDFGADSNVSQMPSAKLRNCISFATKLYDIGPSPGR